MMVLCILLAMLSLFLSLKLIYQRKLVQKVKKQIEFFKKYRKLIQFGTFYRLEDPFEGDGNAAWMCVSPDKKQAVAVYYKVKATPNPKLKKLPLTGLDPDKRYYCSRNGRTYYGDELMNMGLLLDMEFTGSFCKKGQRYQEKFRYRCRRFYSQMYVFECVDN